MDYYEELGVDRSATESEIRHAYKRLVRLLHPDHCEDEHLRHLAEIQTKRLNGIMTLLVDPVDRAQYDRRLAASAPPETGRLVSLPSRPWFWPVMGVAAWTALTLVLAWQPRPSPPAAASRNPSQMVTVSANHAPPNLPETHRQRQSLRVEQPGDGPEIGWQPESSPLRSPQQASPAPADDAPVFRAASMATATSPAIESQNPAPHHTLAGEWLFVPSAHAKTNGLYPPEYIELRITENSGMLHGRYRGRYHIADQLISPDVSFQFEGRAESTEASLVWSGAGGSSGDVTLRLLTDRALEVTWVANQMGAELGLISGTATLIRKLD